MEAVTGKIAINNVSFLADFKLPITIHRKAK
jgi:hypothetical protein